MCCCGYDGGWQQVAMIRPLTWELTCAAGVVLKSRGKKKKVWAKRKKPVVKVKIKEKIGETKS